MGLLSHCWLSGLLAKFYFERLDSEGQPWDSKGRGSVPLGGGTKS